MGRDSLSRLGAYGALLRVPGTRRLFGASFGVGVAQTMTPVAFVLFAREATGSFASAALVLAADTAGGVLVAPFRGRLVDRIGARAAVLGLAVPSAAADVGLVLAGHAHAPALALVALALVAGAVTAPAGAGLRRAWSDLMPEGAARQAGFALQSVNQELTFVTGPLVAGALVGWVSATAAVLAAAILELAGALVFATSRAARTPPAPHEALAGSVLRSAGLRTILGTAAAFGLVFGLLDVAFPAYARGHGAPGQAGLLLAVLAAGLGATSALAGLRTWRTSAARRFPAVCLLAAVGLAPLISVAPLGAMVGFAFIAGACFSPVTVTQIELIGDAAPAGRVAEAFSWMGTIYGAGSAAGAAVAGQLVHAGSLRAVFAAAAAAGLVAYVAARAGARTLSG